MKGRLPKKLGAAGMEIALVLALVLLFFALITILLFKVFPLGITLSQLMEQHSSGRGGGSQQVAAVLTRTVNDVKSKVSASIAWGPAQEGMSLYDHDAVQTIGRSSAQINFDKVNNIVMGGNSLVIIKRMEKERVGNGRKYSLVVVSGVLEGHITSGAHGPIRLAVSTPTAVVNFQLGAPLTSPGGGSTLSQPGSGNSQSGTDGQGGSRTTSDFKISINADNSATIMVYGGEASVTAQGKTVRVAPNTGVTIKQGESPVAARPIPPSAPPPPPAAPAPPIQISPADGETVIYRELPPRVHFAWTSGEKGGEYHLQVATDPSFKELLVDRRLSEPEFTHGNLKSGLYYWRVSRTGEKGAVSTSRVGRVKMVQRLGSPLLNVVFPDVVQEERFVLTGSTDPGNRVFVDGRQVFVDAQGGFSCEVPVRKGMTLVAVEAVDASGEVSFKSQYIRGRY